MRSTIRLMATAAAASTVLVAAPAVAAPRTPAPFAGTLLSSAPASGVVALPSASRTTVIRYTSTGAEGAPIAVSGTVSVPRGKAPAGGWPTISWAHGTTGVADRCAPSRDSANGQSHDYLGPVATTLDTWVKRGYAVVQTDYEGLGTPGTHTYLNGVAEANAVADIVKAARSVDHRIGRNWIAAGHSQGGQAALFAADRGDARQPSLRLRGAVSIAPGGVGLSGMIDYVRTDQPGAAAAQSFLPLIVLGAQAADPSVDPKKIFTSDMDPLLRAASTGCLTQMRKVPQIPSSTVFRTDAKTGPLTSYLAAQDPTRTRPRVPVLVAQGSADTVVAKPGTDAMVTALCAKGADVDYRAYSGADHRAAVNASLTDSRDFVSRVLGGKNPAAACS